MILNGETVRTALCDVVGHKMARVSEYSNPAKWQCQRCGEVKYK